MKESRMGICPSPYCPVVPNKRNINLLIESQLINCMYFLQRVNTLTGESIENVRGMIKQQYEFFEKYTLLHKSEEDWDTINIERDRTLLLKKIGFALYGVPKVNLVGSCATTAIALNDVPEILSNFVTHTTTNRNIHDSLGYSTSQINIMNLIADTIISLSECDPLQFSCIFVTFHNGNAPLFKIKASNSMTLFVDSNCRVYEGFDDFKEHNTLPDDVYCYPENGCYNKARGFCVNFITSPSSVSTSKVFKKADTAGKVVSGVAGVVAAAAIAAPFVGIALSPAVGIIAIVGGGVAGIYGACRGVVRIIDKQKHKEKVSAKDVWNLGTNVLSAVSIGALGAFEKVAVATGRVAQFFGSLNGLTMLCSLNDTPNFTLLLNEFEEDALNILFYFNTSNILEAFIIIREGLKMESLTRTDQILENLVEINSIKSTIDCKGTLRVENYISQGVADLVTTLLKSVNTEIKDLFLQVASIGGAYQNFKNGLISEKSFGEELDSIMKNLQQDIQNANDQIKKNVYELIFKNSSDSEVTVSEVLSSFITEISSTNEDQITLALRNLVFSFISRIRKANKFLNNIEHNAVTLHSYDIKAHPEKEIKHKIREMIKQQESGGDLALEDNKEVMVILKKVVHFLDEFAEPAWKSDQWAQQIVKFTEKIVRAFDQEYNKIVELVNKNQNPNCLNLDKIFANIGLNGNYGSSLLQKVLDDFQPDPTFQVTNHENSFNFTILPAWSGLVDCLYCYSSCLTLSKIEWARKINKFDPHNYEVTKFDTTENSNICILIPCEDSLPVFVVFSSIDSKTGYEFGFIWHDK